MRTFARHAARIAGLCGASIVCVCLHSYAADNSPGETLTRAVTELKSSGNVAALADYVDWEFLFQLGGPALKGRAGSSTVEELRRTSCQLYSDPEAAIKKGVLSQVSSGDHALSAERVAEIVQLNTEQIRAANARYASASYVVGESLLSGEEATVNMEVQSGGVKTSVKVPFHLKKGRWLMTVFPFALPAVDASGRVVPPSMAVVDK